MNIQKKKIHTADIKDIICNDKEIITCSRDGTINILDHELVVRKTLKPNNGFVNAIAKFENHLFAGLQSGLILHYTLEKDYDSFSGKKFLNNDDEKEKDDKEKNITNVYDSNGNERIINDSNGNERIINDSNGNERIINDSNINDSNGNDSNINDSNGNDSNINDSNGNDSNINDSNGNDRNINDSNGNDTNENDFYDPEFISVHSQNVTSLKLTTVNIFGSFAESIDIPKNNFYLVSASWDSKVCILDFCNGRVKFLKFAQGVWNVQIHGGRLYVCGIDKMIYMYEDGMNVGVYALHTSCVRSLCVGLGSLYSLSNDGKVFRWENGLKNCRDLQNISYSLAIFPGKKCVCEQSPGVSTCRCGIVAAAGEKNVTFLSSDLKFLKKIILGVECWTVSATGNLVLVGGGDGNLYVFELDELMKRPEKVIRVPVELTDGEETIKIINEMVYKKSSDQWELIGSVANNTHAFEVEVDGRLLKLTFTDDENTFAIAERFLREHKLGDSYKDDIVDFIRTNFRRKEKFFVYETINVNGIRGVLGKEYEEFCDELEMIKNNSLEKNGESNDCHAIRNAPRDCNTSNDCNLQSAFNLQSDRNTSNNRNLQSDRNTSNNRNLQSDRNSPADVHSQLNKIKTGLEDTLNIVVSENKFVALDIYRYLITKDVLNKDCSLDLAFLHNITVENKKEAIAFTRLITNLHVNPPFDLTKFHKKIRSYHDRGWISHNDLDNYEKNREISMNLNK